jgi:hypothetical protein
MRQTFESVMDPSYIEALVDETNNLLATSPKNGPAQMIGRLALAATTNPLATKLQQSYLRCLVLMGDRETAVSYCEHLVQTMPQLPAVWDTYIYKLSQLEKPRSDIAHIERRAGQKIQGYVSPLSQGECTPYHHATL